MKKHLLYSLVALVSFALTSCNGSYDDWMNPQGFEQDAAAAAYGVTVNPGENAHSVMPVGDDMIALQSIETGNANITGFALHKTTIMVNGTTIDVPSAVIEGNKVMVSANELDNLIWENAGTRKTAKYDLTVSSSFGAKLSNGDAVTMKGETPASITTEPTPAEDPNGYFLMGDFVENGAGWDLAAPVMMNKVGEGLYEVIVTTKNDESNWFKLFQGSHPASGGWDEVNQGQMGCRDNGDDARTNFVVWTGDKFKVETPVIKGKGHFKVQLDVINMVYTITEASSVLWVAGDCNGWKHIDPLISPNFDGIYTGFMYLNQAGFKFCTKENWKGTNYGEDFSTDPNAGNIKMTEPNGYYKVVVDLNAKTYTLTAINSIGVIGPAQAGGWDNETALAYNPETRTWEGTMDLNAGEMKFRANNSWMGIDWGGTLDNLKQGGSNITVSTPGTYFVQLYAWADGYAHATLTKK